MSAVQESETEAPEGSVTDVKVAIVGSGFSGLGTAIRLEQQGMTDFVVLERGDDVGGTWHFNTYPGCACDIPSHLYSFSFAPNPEWSQTYSRQPEIRDYLRATADRFGVRPYIRFGANVRSADWDDEAQRWEIETSAGNFRAHVLISAAGPLTEPKIPDIPGLDSFEGATFHSARWDHDVDLKGKRVASIGTGASAIQYVPEIQKEVAQLTVFQRTPPWIFPHSNREFTQIEKRVYRLSPQLQKIARGGVYVARESAIVAFVKNPKLMRVAEAIAKRHMRKEIADPELIEKITPDYTIGCKRILPSNKWYPALSQDNVELVTSGVKEVREHSIVDADGVEREVDAIIFGTGFEVVDMPVAQLVRGRDGNTLGETWKGSPRAHLGTAIPGFPNFFMLLGPNTGLGHNSMVYMIESQINYVLDALRTMDERGAGAVEVREDAVAGFNEAIDKQLEGTVWNTGCASWYLDDTGRNGTLWPDWTWKFRRRTAQFDAASYTLAPAATPERQAVPA
jgi:cation diffusion facilitator CzcD-associated flavoprotein CzcO